MAQTSFAAGPKIPDWRKTPIGTWGPNGLSDEASRLLLPDWWDRRESPVVNQLHDLFSGLRGVSGTARRRPRPSNRTRRRRIAEHGVETENVEAHSGRPVTSAQIAAAQEDSENDGADELLPDDTESISTWFARIAKIHRLRWRQDRSMGRVARLDTKRRPGYANRPQE